MLRLRPQDSRLQSPRTRLEHQGWEEIREAHAIAGGLLKQRQRTIEHQLPARAMAMRRVDELVKLHIAKQLAHARNGGPLEHDGDLSGPE